MPDPDGTSRKSTSPRRHSWRLQWSLRAFGLIVLLIAMGLMVISYWHRTGELHQDVADQLKGHVYIEWKHEDWQWVKPKPTVGVWRRASTISPWVKEIGADMLFHRIDRVVINNLDAANLRPRFDQLARLDHLPDLSLYDCRSNEEQLAQWMASTSVEKLFAEGALLGRGRLPFLNHSTLTHLHLGRTNFSDPAIDDLPVSLQELNLRRTRITDAGLDKLVRLRNLKRLVINRTPTSKAAVDRLRLKMPWCAIQWEPLENP